MRQTGRPKNRRGVFGACGPMTRFGPISIEPFPLPGPSCSPNPYSLQLLYVSLLPRYSHDSTLILASPNSPTMPIPSTSPRTLYDKVCLSFGRLRSARHFQPTKSELLS